jgi:hypothetical protein
VLSVSLRDLHISLDEPLKTYLISVKRKYMHPNSCLTPYCPVLLASTSLSSLHQFFTSLLESTPCRDIVSYVDRRTFSVVCIDRRIVFCGRRDTLLSTPYRPSSRVCIDLHLFPRTTPCQPSICLSTPSSTSPRRVLDLSLVPRNQFFVVLFLCVSSS